MIILIIVVMIIHPHNVKMTTNKSDFLAKLVSKVSTRKRRNKIIK